MDINNNHHDEETEIVYIQFSKMCKQNIESIKKLCAELLSMPLLDKHLNIIENSIYEYAMSSWLETEKMEHGIIDLLNFFEILEEKLKEAMRDTIQPDKGIEPNERLMATAAGLLHEIFSEGITEKEFAIINRELTVFFEENTSDTLTALKSFIVHLNLILAPLMNGEAEE